MELSIDRAAEVPATRAVTHRRREPAAPGESLLHLIMDGEQQPRGNLKEPPITTIAWVRVPPSGMFGVAASGAWALGRAWAAGSPSGSPGTAAASKCQYPPAGAEGPASPPILPRCTSCPACWGLGRPCPGPGLPPMGRNHPKQALPTSALNKYTA